MQLSEKSLQELKQTLLNVFGADYCKELNDETINEVGILLLKIVSNNLKINKV